MKRFTAAALVLGVVALGTTGVSAQATHTAFVGGIGFVNPCNGEIVAGTGPVKIVYAESPSGHITLHSTFKVHVEGSLGNQYVMSFIGNETFDAPSGSGPGYVYFDSPIHGEVVAKGKALNFSWDIYGRTFVVGGVATGGLFINPSTTTCQGS
jgi:hypothetical protein